MGKIITISGPRGVGKSAVVHQLSKEHGIAPVVPYTTRDMRCGEVEGEDYRFVSDDTFDDIRHATPMFDVLQINGTRYGTPLADFESIVNEEEDPSVRTVNLAANSAIQLKRQLGRSVRTLFIVPASWNDIERQMRERGVSEDEIRKRRGHEPSDLALLPEFDQIVVNRYKRMNETVGTIADYAISAFALDQ